MYPDDPKLNRFTKPSTREQILVVLIAVGVAVVGLVGTKGFPVLREVLF